MPLLLFFLFNMVVKIQSFFVLWGLTQVGMKGGQRGKETIVFLEIRKKLNEIMEGN